MNNRLLDHDVDDAVFRFFVQDIFDVDKVIKSLKRQKDTKFPESMMNMAPQQQQQRPQACPSHSPQMQPQMQPQMTPQMPQVQPQAQPQQEEPVVNV